MRYEVVIHCLEGAEHGKKWKFSFAQTTTVVIGRISGCHLVLKDMEISLSHCLLQIQKGALCLIDMGSQYGTKLNGEMISGLARLSNNDVLCVGTTLLQLEIVCHDIPRAPKRPPTGTLRNMAEPPQPVVMAEPKEEETVPPVAEEELVSSQTVPGDMLVSPPKSAKGNEQTQEMGCAFCGKVTSQICYSGAYPYCFDCDDLAQYFFKQFVAYQIVRKPWYVSADGIVLLVKKTGEINPPHLCYLSKNAVDKRVVEACEREILQLGKQHGHLYPFFRIQDCAQHVWGVTSYIPGSFLHRHEKPMPLLVAIEIMLTIGEAADYGLDCGCVLGNISPQTIYLDVAGQPYLFGHGTVRSDAFFTKASMTEDELYPLYFTAPERITHQASPTPLSEQFSLAATLFHLLTGDFVYHGKNPTELHEEAAHFSPSLEHITPPLLRQSLMSALAANPCARYATVTDFLDTLVMVRASGLPPVGSG